MRTLTGGTDSNPDCACEPMCLQEVEGVKRDPRWQPTIRYEELIEQVRCKWEAAGHRVPIGYNNLSGLPTSTEERAYQAT